MATTTITTTQTQQPSTSSSITAPPVYNYVLRRKQEVRQHVRNELERQHQLAADEATDTEQKEPPSESKAEATPSTSGKKARKSIVWADDVVDNEHLGKKSSKICCIFHKQKRWDESDSESSSSDDGEEKKDAEHQQKQTSKHCTHQHADANSNPAPANTTSNVAS